MFNVDQFRKLIVRPALESLVMFSESASELLVFTCANESDGGTYLHQIHGPALGIYQMEPKTYNDIWQNYINKNLTLKLQLLHNFDAPVMPSEDRMVYDLKFATAMARIFYARISESLPSPNVDDMWNYYKRHYNTYSGKADYTSAVKAYRKFVSI